MSCEEKYTVSYTVEVVRKDAQQRSRDSFYEAHVERITYLAGELIHEKVAGLAGARVSWFSTDSVDAVLITLVQVGVAALVDFDFTTIASVSGAITDAIEAAAIRKFFARSIVLARK